MRIFPINIVAYSLLYSHRDAPKGNSRRALTDASQTFCRLMTGASVRRDDEGVCGTDRQGDERNEEKLRQLALFQLLLIMHTAMECARLGKEIAHYASIQLIRIERGES